MNPWSSAKHFARLFFEYRDYLRHPFTLEDCRRMIRERLARRESRFLSLVKATIFENSASPYIPLFADAGCAYDDVAELVEKDGLEAALLKLRDAGVFLTFEQFKLGAPVVRGGRSYQFTARDFDNPLVTTYFVGPTGGTRSRGTSVRLSLAWSAERALSEGATFEVHGAEIDAHILWLPAPPAVSGVNSLLQSAKVGLQPERWYSMVDPRRVRRSPMSRLGPSLLVTLGRALGARLPHPEYLGVSDAAVLAKQIAELKREGRTTMLQTLASCGVRVGQAAREHDWDIAGTKIQLISEPTTPRRAAEIRAAGATPIPRYNAVEMGPIGIGCANPRQADDLHLLRDCYAVIQHERRFPWDGGEIATFLFSSLSMAGGKILLNVEMDDCGVVETRRCGCGFDLLGYSQHLHTIRSFTKLTGEGTNVMSSEFLRIFEEVLPERYGGASVDYQLVEEEDEKGFIRLVIYIHPRLNAVNETHVLETINKELRKGGNFRQETRDMMLDMWAKAGAMRVRREPPLATGHGKVLPFHVKR